MAIYNEILVARYPRVIQRLFGMKGPAAVRQVAGELAPIIALFHGSEARYLEGWDSYFNGGTALGAAGVNTRVQLRNPPNSGMIAVIESLVLGNLAGNAVTGALVLTTGLTITDLGGVGASIGPIDVRTKRQSSCFFSSDTNAANLSLGNSLADCGVVTGGTSIEVIRQSNAEIPILPGSGVAVSLAANNASLAVMFRWRERALEDSEKNP